MPAYLSQTFIAALFVSLPLTVVSGFSLTPINIVMAIPAIIYFLRTKSLVELKSNILKVYSVFFLWALMSISWSINPSASFEAWIRVATLSLTAVFLFAVSVDISKNKNLKEKLRKYMPMAFIIGAAFFISEIVTEFTVKLFIRNIITPDRENVYSPEDYNKASCFISLFVWPVIAAALLKNKVQLRYILAAFIWLLAAYIIFTVRSSSAMLGFVCASSVFIFIYFTKARFNILIHISVIAVMLVLPVTVRNMDPQQIIKSYTGIPNSAVHRLFIWDFASDAAAEKPMMGWGMKSSRFIPGGQEKTSIDGIFYQRELMPSHPHSSVLQVILELGIVGWFLFICLIYIIFKEASKNKCLITNAATHSLLISYIVVGLFAFGIWRNWWISAVIVSVAFLLMVSNYKARSS